MLILFNGDDSISFMERGGDIVDPRSVLDRLCKNNHTFTKEEKVEKIRAEIEEEIYTYYHDILYKLDL